MKQFLLALLLISSVAVSAQNEKFVGAMQSKLAAYSSAKTPEDFLDLSNAFERIAEAEKNQWLAYYYAAHAQVIYGYMLSQKDASGLDPIADKAEQLINKADALEQNNSEISCIKSMIASLRMFVNPMQRYMQYGTLASQHLETAKQQDPSNPRPYALQSQNLFYTPAQFGGGCTTAKPVAEQGVKLDETFKPKSELHPKWGKMQFDMVLNGCK
ncbi:MAG: hypothetical protein KGZ74_11880 [Chitinophagaceae bacterium]|nr:hypothetical protein [Chitinophagaceae bacterium]